MEEDKRKVKDIIGELNCPKNFRCYKSNFSNLCKAKKIGREENLKCLEKKPRNCLFAFPFLHSYICTCPLRIYIYKKMERKKRKDFQKR